MIDGNRQKGVLASVNMLCVYSDCLWWDVPSRALSLPLPSLSFLSILMWLLKKRKQERPLKNALGLSIRYELQ